MAQFNTPPTYTDEQSSDSSSSPQVFAAKPPKHEGFGSMVSTIAVLVVAPIVALFLTAFVFQSYQVDGPSMETTLHNNDRLLVWKVSRTWAKLTKHDYIPKRGDVIVFIERDMSGISSGIGGKQLIKRVIGLPGDRVVVKDNTATIYNKEHPEGFVPDKTLPYGNVITNTAGERDIIIPDNYVYVLGDNRDNSLDSRSFGPVPAKEIVGKLILRVWPINDVKKF